MIQYDPGYWAVSYFFQWRLWRGSVVPKTVAWSASAALASFVLCKVLGPAVLEDGLEGTQTLSLRQTHRRDVTTAWSMYSFVLGTLIVFRLNQAYARYWECAACVTQVRAKWFNAVSNAFAFCSTSDEKESDVNKFQQAMVRMVSWLYYAALHQLEEKRLVSEILDTEGVDQSSLQFLDNCSDQVEVLLQWIQKLVIKNHEAGVLTVAPPILTRVFHELGQGMFDLNSARKIRDIPIPFPYAHMVTMFLFFHVVFTVAYSAIVSDDDVLALLMTFVSVTAYVGAYYIAHEIERPFGSNMNDLPFDANSKLMNRNLNMLLNHEAQHPPEFTPNERKRTATINIYENFSACQPHSFNSSEGFFAGVSARSLMAPPGYMDPSSKGQAAAPEARAQLTTASGAAAAAGAAAEASAARGRAGQGGGPGREVELASVERGGAAAARSREHHLLVPPPCPAVVHATAAPGGRAATAAGPPASLAVCPAAAIAADADRGRAPLLAAPGDTDSRLGHGARRGGDALHAPSQPADHGTAGREQLRQPRQVGKQRPSMASQFSESW